MNFGHTYGHAFESSMSLKGFSHGQAVGLGMICASKLSMLLGNIEAEEFERIKNVIQAAGLPNKLPDDFNYGDFKEAMSRDKKILSNKLRFITLNSDWKSANFGKHRRKSPFRKLKDISK